MTKIPVVYASDENYTRYMLVSMFSVMKNLSEGNFCRFIILVPAGADLEAFSFVSEEMKAFDNCSVEFITADSAFDDAELHVERLTNVTFFRLGLPLVLPDVDRCLYLDGDTVVVGDIAELWAEDIGDALIGGVEGHNFTTRKKRNKKRLDWDESKTFKYVNAGVLIMNLDGMRKENMVSVFNSMDPGSYRFADQDVINIACADRIEYIPCRYNVRPYYTGYYAEVTEDPKIQATIDEALADPVVYHYATIYKPWKDVGAPFAEAWLQYAMSDELGKYFEDVEALQNDPERMELIADARSRYIEMIRAQSERRILRATVNKQERKIKKQEEEIKELKAKLKKIENSRSYKFARKLGNLK